MHTSSYVIRFLTVLLLQVPTALVATDEPEAEERSDEAQDEVQTGFQWMLFPTFKGNSDAGFIYGAQLAMIDYADGKEPFNWEFRLKLNHSTKNRHQHYLVFDTPHLLPYGLRYALELEVLHINDANYFGIGNETTFDEDTPDLYQFRLTEPRLQTHIRKELYDPIFVVGGAAASFSWVRADPTSLLAIERPIGWEGGRSISGLIGAGVDTRDNEIVTRKGVYAEIYSRFALTPLAETSWFGGGIYQASYWSPFVDWIVIGQRLMFEALGGTPPVTEMMRMGGTKNFRALGGVFSHRGFAENRFIGPTKGLANFEIRAYFSPLFQHLVFGAGPFLDASRVFDGSGTFFKVWHVSSGGEFTINWKESFLFRLDYAVSSEGGEFYIEGRHLF